MIENRLSEKVTESTGESIIPDSRYLPSPADSDGKLWLRTTGLIHGDPFQLYTLWRNVEAAPLWQEHVSEVHLTSETTSHWIMRSGDRTIEWDLEILADEPGKGIVWRSICGDCDISCEVMFEAAVSGQGTIVTVLQKFRVSKLTRAWEGITGRNPKQAMIENIRHFKAFAETGEIPRTPGRPPEKKGLINSMKESLFGETVEAPLALDRKAS